MLRPYGGPGVYVAGHHAPGHRAPAPGATGAGTGAAPPPGATTGPAAHRRAEAFAGLALYPHRGV